MSEYKTISTALHIVGQVLKGKKVRTRWEIQTEYDRHHMMTYRSELLQGCAWLI
jgi:hypothetical protein